MAHITKDKKKILNRVSRIRGQIDAIERLLVEDSEDCSLLLQTIASCRGAINGLIAEVIEGHIRHHIISPDSKPSAGQIEASQELIDVVKTYLK